MAEKSLTAKQEAFVLAYIGEARFNATKAARIAGYSEKTAGEQGYQQLQNPSITARIADLLKARTLTAEAVMAELADVATADWHEFLTMRTNPKTGEVIDVKMDLTNKVKSLELIGKAYGLFTERVDLSGSLTAQVELIGIDEGDI